MYYDRYPVGYPTKKRNTQLHKALDIFCCFLQHKAHNTQQKLSKDFGLINR